MKQYTEEELNGIDSEIYKKLVDHLEGLKPKLYRFYNEGFKKPSSDIRMGLQEAKNIIQELRLDVSRIKNTKKNTKKDVN